MNRIQSVEVKPVSTNRDYRAFLYVMALFLLFLLLATA